MELIRWAGLRGDSASMISCRYGVRAVRYCPGSPEAREDSLRCRSAHLDTVRSGQVQIGAHALATVAQDVLGTVKLEIEILGQIVVGAVVIRG
jgi:hypothetical protein